MKIFQPSEPMNDNSNNISFEKYEVNNGPEQKEGPEQKKEEILNPVYKSTCIHIAKKV